MFIKNFEHHIILYLLIVIFIVNLLSIYSEEILFLNYKKISFLFLIMTIIFVIVVITYIKQNKPKTQRYAKYFIESDLDSNESSEFNESYDNDDLITDYENEIFIEN
jgi:hypothetical protein